MKSVFVFGLFEDSPGKTTFSCGLLHKLQQIGVKPVPLKARAGHNYWYQYNELIPCLKEGRLYCSDIIKLKPGLYGITIILYTFNRIQFG